MGISCLSLASSLARWLVPWPDERALSLGAGKVRATSWLVWSWRYIALGGPAGRLAGWPAHSALMCSACVFLSGPKDDDDDQDDESGAAGALLFVHYVNALAT